MFQKTLNHVLKTIEITENLSFGKMAYGCKLGQDFVSNNKIVYEQPFQ